MTKDSAVNRTDINMPSCIRHPATGLRHLAMGLLLLASTLAPPPSLAGLENRQQADDLMPVDCLLPGQVRKLGGRVTYLSARRPVKTTGVNCEIRGGEYVQYDRADYTTALAIWQPMAEQGDARAQNYVGEIYEKGLGTQPNFALAAQWYERAAQQDYAPAQINLGQLYELGQGVDARKDLAIDLYRKASGIKGKQLRFVSWDYSEEKYQQLNARVSGQEAELARQRSTIQSLTLKLDTAAERESRLTNEVNKSRSQYRQELAALEQARVQVEAQQAKIAALSAQTQKTNAESLATEMKAIEAKRAALTSREQALAASADRSAQEAQALAKQRAELEALEQAVKAREQALAQSTSSASATAKSLESQREHLKELQLSMQSREQALTSREAELAKKSTELTQLNAELNTLREQLSENANAFSGKVDDAASAKAKNTKPVIEMIEPQLLATRGEQYYVKTRAGLDQRTIIGRVLSQNPIMQLMVNEQQVNLDDRGLFQQRIPLRHKDTPVTVVAIDKAGLRSDLNFTLGLESDEQDLYAGQEALTAPDAANRKIPRINYGNYHALLIGNRDYEALPDLTTTISDVTALRDVLRDHYGFMTTLLTNASRYDMLSAMEKLRQELTEDDNLLIYYAGHGELDEVNTRGHWLPVDAEEDSRANWISNVAISDILNSMNANKVLVVADSCYSGSMTRSTLARLDGARSGKAWESWLKKQSKSHSRLLFSSGGVAPVLDGGGGKHSIFAKALLDVLRSNEGVLEGRQIHTQVAQAVNYAALAAQFDQTPMYAPIKFAGHEGGDFLFVANAN